MLTQQIPEGKAMGFRAVDELLSGPPLPVTPADHLVLLAIAKHINDANREKGCWPAVETISAETWLTPRGVQKSVGRLLQLGLIEVRPNTGRGNTNTFLLRVKRVNTVRQKGEHRSRKGEQRSPESVITVNGVVNTERASPAPPPAPPPGVIPGESSSRVRELVEAWNGVAATNGRYRKVDRTTDALLSAIHRNASLTAETLRELMTQARGPRTFVRFLWDSY